MKRLIGTIVISSASLLFAGEESAVDVAKRVIADTSSAYTERPAVPMGVVPKPPERFPEDLQLELAAQKAHEAIRSFMLSDGVPEKARIAYAIQVLHSKRIPWQKNPNMLGIDKEKNQSYLEDGLKLAARLNQITKEAEQAGTGQPATRPESKSEGGDKPQPEAEGRSR